MEALLVVVGLTGAWSAIGGPIAVSRKYPAADPYVLGLYMVRAIPVGVAVIVTAVLAISGMRSEAFPAILIVSATVQLLDVVLALRTRERVLAGLTAVFVAVQVAGAVLLL